MFALASSGAAPTDAASADILRHRQNIHELRPGLCLHTDNTVDRCDLTARGLMEAGLRLVVLLQGAVDISYGERRLMMHCTRPHDASAVLVGTTRSEGFERRLRRGRHAWRISLSMDGDWLAHLAANAEQEDMLGRFMRQHLALHTFTPTPRMVALAGQLAAPQVGGVKTGVLQHLRLESRALELAAQTLETLGTSSRPSAAPARLRPKEVQRMRELHAFLHSDAATGLSLHAIAQRLGMHPNTMQRHFRAQYSLTVIDCLREAAMQRARLALERDGLTVSQAAEIAGYGSAANFATAFRRRFGMPPKWARQR